jgi:hypothetical protein
MELVEGEPQKIILHCVENPAADVVTNILSKHEIIAAATTYQKATNIMRHARSLGFTPNYRTVRVPTQDGQGQVVYIITAPPLEREEDQ